MKKGWTVWKHALGSYSNEDTAGHDDAIALIRTFLVVFNLIAAGLIMVNILASWA
jgi:hypothetical protein